MTKLGLSSSLVRRPGRRKPTRPPVAGAALARYSVTMERHNRPVRLETISRFVREHRLTEREALLLRGTASARGFRGPLQASLTWLEDYSPGVRNDSTVIV
jgi:hypothetical protein